MWVNMQTVLVTDNKISAFAVGKNEKKQLVLFLTKPQEISLNINLTGENAEAEILGIIIGQKDRVINLHTTQNHLAPHTKSNLLLKSVMSNSSCLNFTGLIKIEKAAQKSLAYQRNENILLSSQAKVNSKPYLEILANDVLCTHGATMGEIDQEQIFYLESRGLNRQAASNLIIKGFLYSVLDKISDLAIVERVTNKLKENLLGSLS